MATTRHSPESMRKVVGSPRPKTRGDPKDTKDTFCRNVTIYGHCRYEDAGCNFNHNASKLGAHAETSTTTTQKKGLNFDSPAFTPSIGTPRANPPTLPFQAAAAAPFTPRAVVTPSGPHEDPMMSLNVGNIAEFTPGNTNFETTSIQPGTNGVDSQQFDPFQSISSLGHALPTTPYQTYNMEDNNGIAAETMTGYYSVQNNYLPTTAPPLQYHLYAAYAPHREDLSESQRQAYEFFIPEKVREEKERRHEATYQSIPNSNLPSIDPYHSLVPLDINPRPNSQIFGYPSWIYKARSSKNAKFYCLRRIEGFRPTNAAIQTVKVWRNNTGVNIVRIIDAFTTRAFNDNSLIVVTDYFPLSKTLADYHLTQRTRVANHPTEEILWCYIVQLASALNQIHKDNLAARCIDPTKVILTDKNRIRLGSCAILDILQHEDHRPLIELQQEDFLQFGRLILSIATYTPVNQLTLAPIPALEKLAREYSAELVEVVRWLVTPAQTLGQLKVIKTLLLMIVDQTFDVMKKLHFAEDIREQEWDQEIENSRIARLLIKLNLINDRPEYAHNPDWAVTGERYMLSLMRDHMFHQIDENGRPKSDIGWIITCLNNLDGGSDDMIQLTSRNGLDCFIVSWKELKGLALKTFAELERASHVGGGGNGMPGQSRRR